ncbi:PAS domain S-box protein [bacterium]|nr:PAS domain S-box protein [bacterium]
MNTPLFEKKNFRSRIDLVIVLVVAIIFAIFSITLDLINRLYIFLSYYSNKSYIRFISTEILILLIGALWISYRRWRTAILRQKELEDIFDSINPDVFLVIDTERRILMCNSSLKRMFKYDIDEVIGKRTDFLYLDRRTKPIHQHEIYNILVEEGFHLGSATGRKKTGESMPLEIITGKLSGHRGAVILIRDITERNLSALELMQSETDYELLKMEMYAKLATYKNLLDKLDDGIVIIDENKIVKYANPSAEKILGFYTDEIIGKSVGFPVIQDEVTEIEIIPNSGEDKKRTVEIRTVKIEWDGNPAFLAFIKNITEFKGTTKEIDSMKSENKNNN